MKILMVCLGNICRSPLAEGILKKKSTDRKLNWQIDSAGTGSWHIGEPPDPRSREVALRNGIDISDQKARQLQTSDLHYYDYIFAMDSANYRDILRMKDYAGGTAQVEMILDRANPGQAESVPDPYWDDRGFDQVFQLLDTATDAILDQLANAPTIEKEL